MEQPLEIIPSNQVSEEPKDVEEPTLEGTHTIDIDKKDPNKIYMVAGKLYWGSGILVTRKDRRRMDRKGHPKKAK